MVLQIIIAIVAGAGLGYVFTNFRKHDYKKIRRLSKDEFVKNMRKGQLIDVRKKEEFEQDKIKGARNFRISQMTTKHSKLRRDQSIYLYCNNGKKSYRVAKKLVKNQFKDIFVLDGGLQEYNK